MALVEADPLLQIIDYYGPAKVNSLCSGVSHS